MSAIVELKNALIQQKDKIVLSGVNLEVQRGEFVYLIGKVGSGKTSLLRTLYADLPLRDGFAKVAGYNVKNIKTSQVPYLRRKLGIVFQDFQLLPDRSVYNNLSFVLEATGWRRSDIKPRIKKVMRDVGLDDKTNQMPHQLSGGEQQRVSIARALLNDPQIILADEPTGNLDPDTSEGIMKILNDIRANGKSIIMATHNYTLIRKFEARVVKCIAGRTIELSANKQATDLASLFE